MTKVIGKPNEKVSTYAPKVKSTKIDPEKIGEVIGSGGKTINRIIDETGAAIDIDDDGTVSVTKDGRTRRFYIK